MNAEWFLVEKFMQMMGGGVVFRDSMSSRAGPPLILPFSRRTKEQNTCTFINPAGWSKQSIHSTIPPIYWNWLGLAWQLWRASICSNCSNKCALNGCQSLSSPSISSHPKMKKKGYGRSTTASSSGKRRRRTSGSRTHRCSYLVCVIE